MSPMKPAAHTTVNKVMPINAKNAAFLRVMPGVYTLTLASRYPGEPEVPATGDLRALRSRPDLQAVDSKQPPGNPASIPADSEILAMCGKTYVYRMKYGTRRRPVEPSRRVKHLGLIFTLAR